MPDDTPNLPVIHAAPADPPSVAELASVAERIRGREQAVREGAYAYLRNGADLSSVKRRLDHGAFLPWCEREFKDSLGWSVRTIERMMLAADAIGNKIDSVTNLKVPKTVVYAVTAPSTPAPIRSEFLARVEAGDASAAADALAAIKAAKEQAYDDARRAKLTPDAKAAAEKRGAATLKRHERELAKREAEEAERKAVIAEAVAFLRNRLGADVDAFTSLADRAGYGFAGLVSALRESPPDPPAVEADGTAQAGARETGDNEPLTTPSAGKVPRRGAGSADRYAGFGPVVREIVDAA